MAHRRTIFRLGLVPVLFGALLAWAAPAAAHHAATMYDRSKPRTFKGVVKAFNWVNPHCSLVFLAEGTGQAWTVEATSPGVLSRAGWSRRSLKPGDHIEIVLGPLRDGGAGGIILDIKNLDTGQTLKPVL